MNIATWNVERLKHKRQLKEILSECEKINPDIFVLTETDRQIDLNYKYKIHTPILSKLNPDYYKDMENRVSIFTNYKIVRQYPTFDEYTSLCVELETEKGNLILYGTIIGIFGNREKSFKEDLLKQAEDFKKLSGEKNFCVCGDFNCSFADSWYFTKFGRDTLLETFSDCEIELLTKNQAKCIDHIAISKKFLSNAEVKIEEWNFDKILSDHKGISAELISPRKTREMKNL